MLLCYVQTRYISEGGDMKLLKLIFQHLKIRDFFSIALICILTVVQVGCTISITDHTSALIQNIQYAAIPGSGYGEAEIWQEAGIMMAIAFGSLVCSAVIAFLAARVSALLSTRIRTDVNTKITNMAYEDVKKYQTSSLITRVSNDVQMIQNMFVILMAMVFSAPITAVWAIIRIGTVSGQLAMVPALVVVVLVVLLVMIMILVIPKFGINQKTLDKINGITRENLTGIRVVRAYNAEEYQNAKFDETNKKLVQLNLYTGRIMGLLNPIIMISINAVTLAIYWLGAYLITGGSMTYSELVGFMMLASQIMMSFIMMIFMFVFAPRAFVSAKRLDEILETPDKIKEPEEDALPIEEEMGNIAFENVTFGYPDGDAPVIHNISFEGKKGQTIAFIGATGSGKSTLIQLIPRLYDVSFGYIKLNGVDIRKYKSKTLRANIGVVPQRGLLFSGTVNSNLRLGHPEISDEAVRKAADTACATEFVEKMPGGFEAKIAQGGTNVSGGQRQRLCIARALAKEPNFLIFDDSFSALDFQTDKKVRQNLRENYKNVTKLIVAQRVGTIMDADLIICLKDGQMAGKGTHKELLENCPEYREIALSQMSKEELGL